MNNLTREEFPSGNIPSFSWDGCWVPKNGLSENYSTFWIIFHKDIFRDVPFCGVNGTRHFHWIILHQPAKDTENPVVKPIPYYRIHGTTVYSPHMKTHKNKPRVGVNIYQPMDPIAWDLRYHSIYFDFDPLGLLSADSSSTIIYFDEIARFIGVSRAQQLLNDKSKHFSIRMGNCRG